MSIDNIVGFLGIKTTNYWVNLLRSLPPHEIGVIKVSARLCQSGKLFHAFVSEVSYLVEQTGIVLPIVVEARKHDPLFYQQKLSSALHEKGVSTFECPPSLVHLQPSLHENQWTIDTIFSAPVIEAILKKQIPILVGMGISPLETKITIPGLLLARELVYTLHAKKLILVGHSPVCYRNGECITDILSEAAWQEKIRRKEITPSMARRVTIAFDILSRLGPGHSVQITGPKTYNNAPSTGLLEELLGNGSGTYIALPPQITVYPLDALDEQSLRNIVNEAFAPQKRRLTPNYFETIRAHHPLVYLDSMRKGGAIVYPLENTLYMCKLFTRQDYEGIGIGTTVIQTIYKHFGELCWRTSRNQTKNHAFYTRIIAEYNGTFKETNQFFIYFIGKCVRNQDTLTRIIDRLPSSFEEIP